MQKVIVPLILVLIAVLAIFFFPSPPMKTYYCTALSNDFKFDRVDQTLMFADRYACGYQPISIPANTLFVDAENAARRFTMTSELEFGGTCPDTRPEEPTLFPEPRTFSTLSTSFYYPGYTGLFDDGKGTFYLCRIITGTGN